MRYRIKAKPLIVHCCHCTWCQRETGSAFAVNAVIEASQVEMLKCAPVATTLPSASGKGHVLWRCTGCGVTVWSNYPQAGPRFNFVRVGTLDNPALECCINTAVRSWRFAPPEEGNIAIVTLPFVLGSSAAKK